ncbi:hypothetical protein P5673_021993 [Acropora cervicornis]|uniref:Uncharacterized protein n=1 Tax=Acropora cervicornis TaxID=6130 RepID=A0AAD9Q7F5_ACRCE|nr:hypothetical protein P5673_021993 [Acropora cervicornis]
MERRGMHECMSCAMMVTWQWVRELLKGFSEFQVGVTKNDLIAFEMMGELDAPFQVVLTKMDKLPKGRHQMMIDEVYRELKPEKERKYNL